MEENKNLEGQEQQNQNPDNKPEEKEPTVEELIRSTVIYETMLEILLLYSELY